MKRKWHQICQLNVVDESMAKLESWDGEELAPNSSTKFS